MTKRPACFGTMYNHSESWIGQYCLPCKSENFQKCKTESLPDVKESDLKTSSIFNDHLDKEIKSEW